MRIEIRQDAPVSAELRRIALALSGTALESLSKRSQYPEEAVHESRKAIRSTRALLRLYRKALGKQRYAEHKGLLRQAAQLLSPLRDAHVRLATIDKLIELVGDKDGLGVPLRKHINERLEIMTGSLEHAATKAEALLKRFGNTIEPWPPDRRNAPKNIGKRLSRTFKRVRKRLKQAKKEPTPERLHQLRKCGKDVREQLRMLRPLEPDRIDKLENRFDDLCDELGEARDLYLASNLLSDVAKNWPAGKPLIEKLQREASARQNKLVRKGLKHASRATAGPAKSIKRLISQRW